MTTTESTNTIATLFVNWQAFTSQLAESGLSSEEAFDELNAQRIDIEDAMAAAVPTSLTDLAFKVLVAGSFDDTEAISPTTLAADARRLLGV